MMNSITEGKEQVLAPDADGVVIKSPMPAIADLKMEIAEAFQLKSDGQAQASRERSSIESRTDLRLAATNEAMRADPAREVTPLDLDRDTARRWADLDAADFGRIRSDARREAALDAIATTVRLIPEYADELKKRSPVITEAAAAVNGTRDALEAQQRQQEIDNALKADAAARDAVRSSVLDAAALAAMESVRKAQSEQVREALARAGERPVADALDAQSQFKAPPLDGRVTGSNDPDIAAQRARAIKRPLSEQELSQALKTRFIVTQEKTGLLSPGRCEYTFREGAHQGQTAFVDAGKSLATQLEDKATIRAMIEVATAKNWKEVTVSGTEDFRRNAWLEARVKGLDVKGYEPREADKELLASLRPKKEKTDNRILATDREHAAPTQAAPTKEADRTPAQEKRQKPVHIDADKLTVSEKAVLDTSRAFLASKDFGPEWTQAALRELESKLRGERVYIGEVVSHGPARFQFDQKNDLSYQVTLKTARGDQVVWGKDLAEAMKDRAPGESIVLRNIGKTEVTVTEKIRDQTGQQVGSRDKPALRNAWTAEPLAKFSERARSELAEKQAPKQPAMGVYDGKAPRAPVQTPTQSVSTENQRNPTVQRPGRDR